MQRNEDNSIGTYLRSKLNQTGMSMRKLAQESGVDPSTISRIITGNQRPRPDHLVKIAPVLKLTLLELWQAAGYIKDEHLKGEPGDRSQTTLHSYGANKEKVLQSKIVFNSCTLPSIEGLDPEHIIAELDKYRIYAQTAEGQETITQNFNKKLDQIKGVGPFINKLQTMYTLYLDEETGLEMKHIIGSALLYFILPTDIIPDYLFPIGYIDDAMATDLIWHQIQGLLAKKNSPNIN